MRTGLEDNIRIDHARLARSNTELVSIAVELCERHGIRAATSKEARARLGLPAC